MNKQLEGRFVSSTAQALLESFAGTPSGHALGRRFIPTPREVHEIIRMCRALLFPGLVDSGSGFDDSPSLSDSSWLEARLSNLVDKLRMQVARCLCYGHERLSPRCAVPCCEQRARDTVREFVEQLPAIRALLIEDAVAALRGDPAASSIDEIILAYPGFLAITVHRLAHMLFLLEVPLMPRMMSEWAHCETGADIHPGASIGGGFFLDHATGAVIGATAKLGKNVRLYQGVTLGAISLPRDRQAEYEQNNQVAQAQRHPTIGDGVTIYANASILGGKTVIGDHCVIGGSVVIIGQVPSDHTVSSQPTELRLREHGAHPAEWAWEI